MAQRIARVRRGLVIGRAPYPSELSTQESRLEHVRATMRPMSDAIRFRLNGVDVEVRGVDPNTTLLDWIRQTGATGSKEGCAEGECGACSVAFLSRGPSGAPRYEAINSCLLLIGSAHGREVLTVEGIAGKGPLHPVQEAMAEAGGSQCGYCTPGFVVSLFAEFYRADEGPLDPESISGNLCRCTGYRPIRDATERLSQVRVRTREDRHRTHLRNADPGTTALNYSASPGEGARRFHRPTRLDDALRALASEPELRIVNGGTDVVVEVNQRHSRFPGYLALDGIEELRGVRETELAIEIGAGTPLAHLEEVMHGKVSMLDQLWPLFSSRLIRTRATLGGNLANGSPIGDSPPALLALDARVVLTSAEGQRELALDSFFLGYRKTALLPGELITVVRIPKPLTRTQRFYKVSRRRLDDISAVAAAFSVTTDSKGMVSDARMAFGGVAAIPKRATRAERALVGNALDERTLAVVQSTARAEFQPIDDHRASAAYRSAMVGTLVGKFFAELSQGTKPDPGNP